MPLVDPAAALFCAVVDVHRSAQYPASKLVEGLKLVLMRDLAAEVVSTAAASATGASNLVTAAGALFLLYPLEPAMTTMKSLRHSPRF